MDSENFDSRKNYYVEDGASLKELILSICDYSSFLWSKKWFILMITALVTSLFVLRASMKDVTYTAAMSFMVNDNSANDQGRLFRDRDQFRMAFVENNKITELARSGRIIHKVILTKVEIDAKNDYLANHIINTYNLHEIWNREPIVEEYQHLHLKDFYFSSNNSEEFSPREIRALSQVHEIVSGNQLLGERGLMSISYNNMSDIFRLNIKATNESLSMRLVDEVFNALKSFYTEETIGRTKKMYNTVSTQADSILLELTSIERKLAYAEDRNRNVTSSLNNLNISNLQRESLNLSSEYSAILQNVKNLEFILTSETPEFQVIDRTFLPIKNEPSKIRAIILGGFLGMILSCGFFMSRKIIFDALNSESD